MRRKSERGLECRGTNAQHGAVPGLRRTPFAVPALCVFAMSSALAFGWGFTVDDALISTRVAHHLHTGLGYRFNPDAELVDCVTPLGWAHLLSPFAADPWSGLSAARWISVLSGLAMALLLGMRCRAVEPLRALGVAVPLAVCLPLGAWSSSGMETSFVALLVSLALFERRLLLLGPGLAAALRPECIPLAFALGALWPAESPRERAANAVLALAPALFVALLRASLFGHPAPLSVFAKPSDFGSGLGYAASGTLLLGVPVLLLVFRSYRSLSRHARALAAASLAHVGAIVLAGGDWMALFRLFVPVLPLWFYLAFELSKVQSYRRLALGSLAATAISVSLLGAKGAATRGVWENRAELVRRATPELTVAYRVAALDVGWVGAATRAPVVDLAGVTDPEVAFLPGGHTSKRLPNDFLLRREPDTLVLLLAPGVTDSDVRSSSPRELHYARAVEQRVLRLEGAEEFTPVATLPLGGGNQLYVVLRRLGAGVALRSNVWNRAESASVAISR